MPVSTKGRCALRLMKWRGVADHLQSTEKYLVATLTNALYGEGMTL